MRRRPRSPDNPISVRSTGVGVSWSTSDGRRWRGFARLCAEARAPRGARRRDLRDGPRRRRQRGLHARRCGGPVAVWLGRWDVARAGDFAKDEYEWYFGWSDIEPCFQEHVHTTSKVLIPGMGNVLSRIWSVRGWAMPPSTTARVRWRVRPSCWRTMPMPRMPYLLCRMLGLGEAWTDRSMPYSRRAVDALYSDDTDRNVRKAAEELRRVLKPGGIFMSVSGVVRGLTTAVHRNV